MGAEEALELVDTLVFNKTGERLDKSQRIVLREFWEDKKKTYQNIAESLNYTEAHLKAVGSRLWKLLSKVLGEKVSKTNFRAALEGYRRTHTSSILSYAPTQVVNTEQVPDLDLNFVGREGEIAELNNLVRGGAKIILIQGGGGVGKTTLARQYLKTQDFEFFLELWMPKEPQNIIDAEGVVEEWLRKDFQEEPGRELGINLERLRRKLRDGTRKIGVLIDNLETALDKNGKIIPNRNPYVELLRVLADPTVKSVTIITSRERLHESGCDVTFYTLKGLDVSAWKEFFASRQINSHSSALNEIWKAFGGNAKAMQIISGVVKTDFEGDVDTYWRENKNDLLIEKELENLVASQFERLARLDTQAYSLLCRLGCYRYQDVTHVDYKGLQCLLWDVPEKQHKRVVKSLCERSLLEWRKEKYWLHPVISTEALAQLRKSGEWETANRKAAEFWTSSVTKVEEPQHALMALEAYRHYMEIGDFKQAADVITRSIHNKWDKQSPLVVLFSRLGLIETLISVIKPIINQLNSDYPLSSKLYNTLGHAYRRIGNVQLASEYHQLADQIAEKYGILEEKLYSQYNLGLCYVDLWETELARKVLNSVKTQAQTASYYSKYLVYSQYCLAFLDSCIGRSKSALALLKEAQSRTENSKLSSWSKGTSLVFAGLAYRNLHKLDTSFKICQRTIWHCEQHQFTSLKARAIDCLATLHREQSEFDTAIEKHLEAIESMTKIGERCNLAEAYYQLGLTYQRIGEWKKSQENFLQAICLYNAIPAPKQVEKVQAAMGALCHYH
jgi:tetratricopeptide (TPR) repeat protein